MVVDSSLVSVLMPVYNAAHYIREAIDSILSQTYANFELIVLDDSSSDGSMQIVDMYADTRIVRYRSEGKVGLAHLLNIGVQMSRGDYIARMDADDISLPYRIEKQVMYLETHADIDLCSCAMQLFDGKDETWVRCSDSEECKFVAMFYSPVLHASSMWRKKSFAGLFYDQSFFPAEDYRLWTKALLWGKRLSNIPDVLYKYRIHATQVTASDNLSEGVVVRVRQQYIEAIFQNADDALVQHLVHFDEMLATKPETLFADIQKLVEYNRSHHFFDNSIGIRCRRFFQNRLYEYLIEHPFRLKSFLHLRFKLQIKLLYNKICLDTLL